jgi:hypothetical protein
VFRCVASFAVLSLVFHTVRSYFECAIKKYVVGKSLAYIQWKALMTLYRADMAGRAKKYAPYRYISELRTLCIESIDTVWDRFKTLS